MDGFINLNKPKGITSQQAVAAIRRFLPTKQKVGHTGTLDPDARGVLPICLGKATRLAEYITDFPKTYQGELTLGITTSTQDAGGYILRRRDASYVSQADLLAVLPAFCGKISQVPPMVSAAHYQGKRLYKLAWAGLEVPREPREVQIFDLRVLKPLTEEENPKALMEITCSKGTYIRTLFNDIGEAIGFGGHMSDLLRVAVGDFCLAESFTLEQIAEFAKANDWNFVLPIAWGIGHLPAVCIEDEQFFYVLHGNKFTFACSLAPGTICRVEDKTGKFLAIGQVLEGELVLHKVLISE